MKRFVMAVALTGVFSLTTLAGNVPTNDFAPPPPAPRAMAPNPSITPVDKIVSNLILTITALLGRR